MSCMIASSYITDERRSLAWNSSCTSIYFSPATQPRYPPLQGRVVDVVPEREDARIGGGRRGDDGGFHPPNPPEGGEGGGGPARRDSPVAGRGPRLLRGAPVGAVGEPGVLAALDEAHAEDRAR